MRSQIIVPKIKLIFFLFLVLGLSSPLTTVAQPVKPSDEITFSPFLLTWDLLQQLAWKQWIIQFPIELAKWGQRQQPDGSSLLINGAGEPKMEMQVASQLNKAHTARLVELSFKNLKGSILFQITFLTHGTHLKPYDINLIRQGIVPFSSTAPNETYTDMRMWIIDTFAFRIRTFREVKGDVQWIKVKLLGGDDTPYITYTERVSPTQRYFRYDMDTASYANRSLNSSPGAHSMVVVKTILPGQFQGNEEYFIDESPIDVKTFRDSFDKGITSWVVRGWQSGMASLLTVLQKPDDQLVFTRR